MRPFFVIVLLLKELNAVAQFNNTVSGFGSSSIDNPAYVNVSGNPYIPLTFQKAVCLKNTGAVDTLMVRLDTNEGVLEILKNNKIYLSKNTYKQFQVEIEDEGRVVLRSGFKAVEGQNEQTFYQVRYDGKTKLLKLTRSKIDDCYEYNDVYKKCFKKFEFFYIQNIDGQLSRIDKDRELIWDLFGTKKDSLMAFSDKNKLRLKKWGDVCKILEYYDSL